MSKHKIISSLLFVFGMAITSCSGHNHKYDEKWTYDDTNHWHECLGKKCTDVKDKAEHKYDNNHDTDCNVCGYVRTIVHEFETTWSYDKMYHFHKCKGCDEIKDKAIHTFTEWTVKTEAGFHKDRVDIRECSVCHYKEEKIVSDTGTHTYSTEWKVSKTMHWHESTCEHETPLKKDEGEHTFSEWSVKTPAGVHSDEVDIRECSVCHYTEEKIIENTGTHTFSSVWKVDEHKHWHESTCEHETPLRSEEAEHDFDEWKVKIPASLHTNELKHRFCKVCNYEETKTTENSEQHTFVWKNSESEHWQESTCEHDTPLIKNKESHTWSEWKVKIPATYTANRIDDRTCSICGRTEVKEIPGTMIPKVIRNLELPTISPISFDGASHPVRKEDLTYDNDEGGLTIQYRLKGKETFTNEVPIKVGTYEYRVTLGSTTMYTEVSKIGEFIIEPYVLTLPDQSVFEIGRKIEEGLVIHDFDNLDKLKESWTDEVQLCIPDKYQVVGFHEVPVSELVLNDANFKLDVGSKTTINVAKYDTRSNIAYIDDIVDDGSDNLSIQIIITQGTFENVSSFWVEKYADWLYAKEMQKDGVTITKATIGEKIRLVVSKSLVDTSRLKLGMMISTSSTLFYYDSAFATVRTLTTEEGGARDFIGNGFLFKIYFPDINTTYDAHVTWPTGRANPGVTQENTRIDLDSEIVNWENREFVIKTFDNKMLSKGTITSCHKHTSSILVNGKCDDCSYNHYEDITFNSETNIAESSLYRYLKGETRFFYTRLTGVTSGYVSYKFTPIIPNDIDASGYVNVKLYNATTGVELSLTDGAYIYRNSGSFSVRVQVVGKYTLNNYIKLRVNRTVATLSI